MPTSGEYLGMRLEISDLDAENRAYFEYCAAHDFRLQACTACSLLRYPHTTACPWCANPGAQWTSVQGRGAVYSYGEVHQAIQPAFKTGLPYHVLLVELDTQQGKPSEHEALRVVGNLVEPDGTLASPERVRAVGIGTRVRMVFIDVAKGLALPQWTVDEEAEQPAKPWRYVQD